ncbi:L-histidine N(alpha)-methyltransferase [Anabaenopsis elenkinii]|uniref:L-histidine N(Alpha)-methyltransferase n=1 Tax=Anabaenopsis elenkinii CCIBt3563 TaxID=2779889 RepID=A0A7U3NLV9_9CYAN|nr:L-histidine N(alpha)-methyltransferase [Anabaenopsis elenkinii]QOV21289.1 L-histidine N(alpha)-methyltransferase [Anabaenopsis elenkinii CCIBt3563]
MIPKKTYSNSQPFPDTTRLVEPSLEFNSIFSHAELLELVHSLELKREIPLKYGYKGQGGKIWHSFYEKYLIPKWFQPANVEIDLLQDNFDYINGSQWLTPGDSSENYQRMNIIDVGAGNSYPVKKFISRLVKLGRINKYIALDISQELLSVSKANLTQWFPQVQFESYTVDIENAPISPEILGNQDIPKIFLHLGVTIGNHQDRSKALQNFRHSMNQNDLLVFTNEVGDNSQWDGIPRGGLKYHVDGIYRWMTDKLGIAAEDCQLVRKYDIITDSVTANIKFHRHYTINFRQLGIDKTVGISADEEVTIWRHHKYQIPELMDELAAAGLEVVHYSCNRYLSHIMVICQVAESVST